MKSDEEVLREIALDEIRVDKGDGQLVEYTRKSFESICKVYSGKATGTSVAVLEPEIKKLRATMRDEGRFRAWQDRFFEFRHMARHRNIYEVKNGIKAALREELERALGAPSPR
jgi:hypothetical protein